MYNNSTDDLFLQLDKTKRLMDKSEIKIIFGSLMGTLCLLTTVGNICVIYRYRKASMVGNLFIISLACADLIVGCVVMPLATVYAITEIWTMTLPICQLWLSADYTASTASILNLLTLSLDRYWSITSPLKYLGKRTKSRALIMISIAWSLSLLWLVPIFGWPYFFNQGIRHVPEDKCNTEYDKNILFKIITGIVNFYLPLIAMISINTKIYLVISKRYHSPIMKYSSVSVAAAIKKQTSSNCNINANNQINKSSDNSKLAINNSKIQCLYNVNKEFNSNLQLNIESNKKKSKNSFKPVKTANKKRFIDTNNNSNKKIYLLKCCFLNCKLSNNNNENEISELDKILIKNHSLLSSETKKQIRKSNKQNFYFRRNRSDCFHYELRLSRANSHRSITDKIRANRSIPSNSIKMSKFLINERDVKLSPLFLKSSSLKNFKHNQQDRTILNDSDSNSYNDSPKNVNKNKKIRNKSIIREKKEHITGTACTKNLIKISKESHIISINHTNSIKKTQNSNKNNNSRVSFSDNKSYFNKDSNDFVSNSKSYCKTDSSIYSNNNNNKKGFMNKQEKAFKQLAAIVIGFTICFLPYFTIFLIVAICEDCISEDLFTASVWLGYLNSTINPFLYALSHKNFFKKSKINTKTARATFDVKSNYDNRNKPY